MRIMNRLRRAEYTAQTADLAAPQPFPLTGDGAHTAALARGPRPAYLAGALADARYRDWLAHRRECECIALPRLEDPPPYHRRHPCH